MNTLEFTKKAIEAGFERQEAEFLAEAVNTVHKDKVGNEYLDQRLKQFSNEMTIKLGGIMVIGMGVLGFILKH